MKVLVYLGHPAQYLFLRATIKALLLNSKHHVLLVLKEKDVLEALVKNDGHSYIKITQNKKRTKLKMLLSLVYREIRFLITAIKFKPDILIGTDPVVAHSGWLLHKPSIITLEDDYNVIPKLAKITYPFCSKILVPIVCDVSLKYQYKKIGYEGYMKLGYLHPNIFSEDINNLPSTQTPYILIRLSSLQAHHDDNIGGISDSLLMKIVSILKNYGDIFISSERKLPECFSKYLLDIPNSDIHSFMYYSELFISDSQSMSVEAAMLGTPSIRFSDFAGKISVLEELEHKYQLSYGIPTNEPELLLDKIKELTDMPDRREIFQKRRQKMLADKIDVTAFMVWFIENYPKSVEIMEENPDYQYRFK